DDRPERQQEHSGTFGLCRERDRTTDRDHSWRERGTDLGTAEVCHEVMDRCIETCFLWTYRGRCPCLTFGPEHRVAIGQAYRRKHRTDCKNHRKPKYRGAVQQHHHFGRWGKTGTVTRYWPRQP